LKHEVLGLKPRAKSWRQTVVMIPDDELSRNAEKLGREWRERANKDWFAILCLARVPSAVRYTAYE